MAHIPKQPKQEQSQHHQQIGSRTKPNYVPTAPATSYQSSVSKQPKSQITKAKTKTDPVELDDKTQPMRCDPKRQSRRLVTYPLETQEGHKLELVGISQPTKHFAKKCLTEFQALLETIRPQYHDDIKSLYEDQAHVDLYIKIGDLDLKKPLHKCMIASRAFKLYCALKEFRARTSKPEADIIVAELQKANSEDNQASSPLLNEAGERGQEDQTPEAALADKKEEQLREALESFSCELPVDLVNVEYLLSLARRAYLDQDISEEETHIYQLILNWLKINRPESIKSPNPNRRSLDHRESFRTIQADFDQLSISDSGFAMSANEHTARELQRNIDDSSGGDASQTSNTGDDIQPTSSLTRTETFELLTKTNPDSDGMEPSRDDASTLDEEDKDRSELSVNTSESSELYTPVTRTGLKPKQFTPIVAVKSKRSIKTPPSTSVKLEASGADNPSSTSKRDTEDQTSGGPTAATCSSISSISKRSSLTTGSPNLESSASTVLNSSQTSSKPRGVMPTKTPPRTKPTIITRAHPISLERSQSPATSSSKGTTKNFIVANKKMISQIERKITTSVTHQNEHPSQTNDDSENDVTDASLLAVTEQLNTNNLASQLDKFALVSYSKLANALSQMFVGEILTDMVVLTRDNKEIGAHRCILAARSVYLSDQITKLCLPSMTSESSNTAKQLIKVDLSDFSYAAVYFSMLHIYSGIVKVPDDLEMEELTEISHLLHVGTLRQVCMHNLKMNYCHYFHKPCNVCCQGVLKTLPIAWRYDLTELYTKCLQWVGAHFAQIFCLEEFSNLKPQDLIEECYKETLSQLTPDNVIQKTIECQKLLKSLPRVKWTESIICLVGRQLEDFCHYVADNYEKILQSQSFLNLGKSCWECEVLEENLLAAMNHLKPDSGCKTLIQLDKIECSIETYCDEPRAVSETFANLISKMRKYCERYLLKDAAAVVHCSSWRSMNPSLQRKIKDQALIASDFDEPTRHLSNKPKLPSMSRHQVSSSPKLSISPQPVNSSSEGKSPSNRSTPDSRLKSPNTTYLPPPKTKPAAARHVKVLK